MLITQITSVTVVALAAALSGVAIAAVSYWILRRQEQAIANVQQLAGIRSVEPVEAQVPNALSHVLRVAQPKFKVRIVSATGSALLTHADDELTRLLERGVQLDVLLLDPESSQRFAERIHGAVQVRATTASLERLAAQYAVRLRYFRQPILESLIFVDDEELWLAPAFPFVSSRPLMYRIINGPNSLYRLYEAGIEFLWSHGEPAAWSA